MAEDKGGRPILSADDWKTGKDRKKESPVINKSWYSLLLYGLIVIVGLAVFYWKTTEKERESMADTIKLLGPSLGIIGLVLFGICVYNIYFGGQCPKCRRLKATEETGATKSTGGGFWSSGTDEYEISCKYCSHREWVEVKHDSGGGCGS